MQGLNGLVCIYIACHAVSDVQSALNKCKFFIINPDIFIRDNESFTGLLGTKAEGSRDLPLDGTASLRV